MTTRAILLSLILLMASASPGSAQRLTVQDFQRAERLFEAGQYEEARKIHEFIAADYGYVSSQFRLGWIFQRGLGVPVDCLAAARWYTFAANQGDPAAAFNLYGIYGSGCENLMADPGKSARWLKKSAELGNAVAMAQVALELADGSTFEKSPFEAFDFAARAAAGGDGYGVAIKGFLTAYGVGTHENAVQGLEEIERSFFLESAYTGHRVYVATTLSEMYEIGTGAIGNLREAFKWALVAEKLGSTGGRVATLAPKIDAASMRLAEQEANRLLRDSVGTSLSTDDMFRSALASDNPKERLNLARLLESARDIRADFIYGLLQYEGAEGMPKNVDEALVKLKQVCHLYPNGLACIAQASALAQQGRAKEAKKVLRAIERPIYAELGQSQLNLNVEIVKLYVSLGMADVANGFVTEIERNDPAYAEIESLKRSLIVPTEPPLSPRDLECIETYNSYVDRISNDIPLGEYSRLKGSAAIRLADCRAGK